MLTSVQQNVDRLKVLTNGNCSVNANAADNSRTTNTTVAHHWDDTTGNVKRATLKDSIERHGHGHGHDHNHRAVRQRSSSSLRLEVPMLPTAVMRMPLVKSLTRAAGAAGTPRAAEAWGSGTIRAGITRGAAETVEVL